MRRVGRHEQRELERELDREGGGKDQCGRRAAGMPGSVTCGYPYVLVRRNDPGVILEDDARVILARSTQSSSRADDAKVRGLGPFRTMRTWTATATAEAHPAAVLHVLTDPDAASRWAPVPFDVEDGPPPGRRLAARASPAAWPAVASASTWRSTRPTSTASR